MTVVVLIKFITLPMRRSIDIIEVIADLCKLDGLNRRAATVPKSVQ